MLFTVCSNPQIHTKCEGQKIGALFSTVFVSAPLPGSQRVKQKTCQWLQHLCSQVYMSRPARSWHSPPLACPLTMFVCASYFTMTHSHVNFIGRNDLFTATLCCVFVENPISLCGAHVIFVLQHCQQNRIEFLDWLVLKFKNRTKNNGFDDFVH